MQIRKQNKSQKGSAKNVQVPPHAKEKAKPVAEAAAAAKQMLDEDAD